ETDPYAPCRCGVRLREASCRCACIRHPFRHSAEDGTAHGQTSHDTAAQTDGRALSNENVSQARAGGDGHLHAQTKLRDLYPCTYLSESLSRITSPYLRAQRGYRAAGVNEETCGFLQSMPGTNFPIASRPSSAKPLRGIGKRYFY